MYGDCSSATARATFNAPSNTGSPVVFMKSAITIVSCSVNVPPPLRDRNGDTTATIATSEATAAAIIQNRPAEAAVAAGFTASAAPMSAADEGRSAGLGDSARITTRSSFGSTPSTMVDGSGK